MAKRPEVDISARIGVDDDGTYMATNMRCHITAPAGGAEEMFVNFHINGGARNLGALVEGTGEWEDISNSDSLSPGDLINVKGAGVGLVTHG